MSLYRAVWIAVLIVVLTVLVACQEERSVSVPGGGEAGSSLTASVPKFSCQSSAAVIRNTDNVPRLSFGGDTVYIGTNQASSTNQNPVVVRLNANDEQVWCRDDYERTGVDGRGYGLLRTATGDLYVVFSVDGGSNDFNSNDFNFNAAGGWLSSYGPGGGAKVAVLTKLNVATGASERATFISAVLNSAVFTNENTNTLSVTGLNVNAEGNIVVRATTAAAPRFADKTRMPRPDYDGSIEDYTLVLLPDLSEAVSATAPSCGNP